MVHGAQMANSIFSVEEELGCRAFEFLGSQNYLKLIGGKDTMVQFCWNGEGFLFGLGSREGFHVSCCFCVNDCLLDVQVCAGDYTLQWFIVFVTNSSPHSYDSLLCLSSDHWILITPVQLQ